MFEFWKNLYTFFYMMLPWRIFTNVRKSTFNRQKVHVTYTHNHSISKIPVIFPNQSKTVNKRLVGMRLMKRVNFPVSIFKTMSTPKARIDLVTPISIKTHGIYGNVSILASGHRPCLILAPPNSQNPTCLLFFLVGRNKKWRVWSKSRCSWFFSTFIITHKSPISPQCANHVVK